MGTHNTPTPTDPDQLVENTQRALDLLCQHLRNNLIKRFTMSDLEEISGFSARTLQYQFKKQFGCSPMRWIAQQRLDACQKRFLTGQDGDSVTAVALAFGFTNLGNFARRYFDRFGEKPSETLGRRCL